MAYGTLATGKSVTRKKIRITDIVSAKKIKKLSAVTCYDATMARLIEKTPIDIVLVGDSLGHVIKGENNTLNVTVAEIVYHTRCVARVLHMPLLVADMPFGSVGFGSHKTFLAAERLLRAGAEAIKIEGATPEVCQVISQLVRHGIPVMGHLGLTPQSLHALGGYKIQGKSQQQKTVLLEQAQALQQAGCFAVVLELVASTTAQEITQSLTIPTIGIGAGVECDGQILVLQDLLGMNLDFKPSFLKYFAHLENTIIDALCCYDNEVKEKIFPQ